MLLRGRHVLGIEAQVFVDGGVLLRGCHALGGGGSLLKYRNFRDVLILLFWTVFPVILHVILHVDPPSFSQILRRHLLLLASGRPSWYGALFSRSALLALVSGGVRAVTARTLLCLLDHTWPHLHHLVFDHDFNYYKRTNQSEHVNFFWCRFFVSVTALARRTGLVWRN